MKLKELMEKRAEFYEELTGIVNKAREEKRGMTEEEKNRFDELEGSIKEIDATVDAARRARALEADQADDEGEGETTEQMEIRAFADYIRAGEDSNITKTDNGAVIPKTVVNKIIDKVKDISPLFRDAEKFNIRGNIAIPYVDASNDNITVAYSDEFVDLEAKSTKLLSVNLTGFLAGALAKISKSLINATDLDLVEFVTTKLAAATAEFIDHEIVVGTAGKVVGLSNATQIKTAAAAAAVTMDEIIQLKDMLKSVFQDGAYFVMNPETLTAVRLLKDQNLRYYVNDDVTSEFGVTLLGKPVYVSDQMPKMAAGKAAIVYINPAQALAVKLVEDSVQVLNEKYATQHAVGIVNWVEFDAAIQNQQAVAVLKMKAA